MSLHAKWTTTAPNPLYVFSHFQLKIRQIFFCFLRNFTHSLPANKGITAYVELCVFVVWCFCLSVEKLGLYIFLNISIRTNLMYLNTVYEYVIVLRCWWERVQWLCSVLSMFAQPTTNLYLCRPGENESWPSIKYTSVTVVCLCPILTDVFKACIRF